MKKSRMNKHLGIFWAVVITLASCGIIDEVQDAAGDAVGRVHLSCDLRTALEKKEYCQEWRNSLTTGQPAAQAICTPLGGKFAKTACPSEGILGGCYIGELGDGAESYWWYYADSDTTTPTDVRKKCEGAEDKYVDYSPAP